MNKNKTIFILTQQEATTTVGGAITIFVNMCNLLQNNGYKVYGICSNPIDGKPRNLDNNVEFINLYYKFPNKSFSEAVNLLAQKENPSLFIFFFPHIYIASNLNKEFDEIPRILMLHSRPDFYFNSEQIMLDLKKQYKNTTAQILFDSYKNLLPDYIKNNKIITIPNGVSITNKSINTDIEHRKIIYLSRIDCWKGLEFLIHSFKCIVNKYPDWSIDIYGESQPKDYVLDLIKLTKKLKIDKQINFKGITANPIETMLDYDFCVFPSYFEGFPVGLIESLSVGLPCIGLEECSGVNELIINNKNGFLTQENYESFANKIELLITNKNLRKEFSIKAKEIAKLHDKASIDEKWLDVIGKIIQNETEKINYTKEKETKKLFSLDKIYKMLPDAKIIYKPHEYIFSIKNLYKAGKKKKVLCILGIKITFSKKNH